MTFEWSEMKLRSCFILGMDNVLVFLNTTIIIVLFTMFLKKAPLKSYTPSAFFFFNDPFIIPTVENWDKTWRRKIFSSPPTTTWSKHKQCIFGRIKFNNIPFIIANLNYQKSGSNTTFYLIHVCMHIAKLLSFSII